MIGEIWVYPIFVVILLSKGWGVQGLAWNTRRHDNNNNNCHTSRRLSQFQQQKSEITIIRAAGDDDEEQKIIITDGIEQEHYYYYDLVIIGAGASGLFASGAATSFFKKILLIDQGEEHVGGDCTNAACVPSKALRSIARVIQREQQQQQFGKNNKSSPLDSWNTAVEHMREAVTAVQRREDVSYFDQVANLDFYGGVSSCRFVSPNELELVTSSKKQQRIRFNKVLIATGASPVIPHHWTEMASHANLPLFTYRQVLSSPNAPQSFWTWLLEQQPQKQKPRIVIVGGGPTAVELGQALARLDLINNITMVAPTLLPQEDVTLQHAACQILRNEANIHLLLGKRVMSITTTTTNGKAALLLLDDGDNNTSLLENVDAMIVCVGRHPTVESLDLEAANIAWTPTQGVMVYKSSLQSHTNSRAYACGDCCSAVTGKQRKASHGAWTGYHAIRNMIFPWTTWFGNTDSVHPAVPSVTFSDPELASVGFTKWECIQKYGMDGFVSQSIRDEGNDRADMDREERFVGASFMELHATKGSGRILGFSACGPAAAELANEMGLAISNHLTVRDVAKSIHAYPSHGYLLHRLALSMALSTVRGYLDALGPIGRLVSKLYGVMMSTFFWNLFHPKNWLPWKRKRQRKWNHWQAMGEQQSIIIIPKDDGNTNQEQEQDELEKIPISFLDFYHQYENGGRQGLPAKYPKLSFRYTHWVQSRPT